MNQQAERVIRSLLLGLMCFVTGAEAMAIGDRDNSAPTTWQWRYGYDQAKVDALISQGYRIVDLEVEQTSPYLFSVAFVKNTGAHSQPSWWWYYGKTENELKKLYDLHDARITDLEWYTVNGSSRFAAIMIPNTGANAAAWWWTYGKTEAELKSIYGTNNARITDIEQRVVSGSSQFAAVMIQNTGPNKKGWWWYYGKSEAELKTLYSQNKARIVDLERGSINGKDDFAAVMVDNTGSASLGWWWLYGKTQTEINKAWGQYGARIIDVQRYSVNGNTRFAVVMLNNSNALTTRVGKLLRAGTDGCRGVYLKEVNGSVRASLLEDFQFEPASTMKTLHHVHAMRQVSLGSDQLSNNLVVNTSLNGSCPTGTQPVTRSLQATLQRMMEQSNNADTMAVENRYGRANINATAAALGMTNTTINHTIGCFCAFTPSELTLADMGRLHESVANGYLGNWRDTFIDLMVNGVTGYPAFGAQRLLTVINSEAANVGLTSTELSAFTSAMRIAYKDGRYTCGSTFWRTTTGWIELPFVSKAKIQPKEYVIGGFAHEASNLTNAEDAVSMAVTEVLRDEINAAMQTFKGVTFGSFTKFGSSCASSLGIRPTHSAFGCATVGEIANYKVFLAPSKKPAILLFGASSQSTGPIGLPLEMSQFGAPGCHLRVSPDLALNVAIDASGVATVPIKLATLQSMIGAHFYTQFLILDRTSNPMGVVFTNGYDTLVGG